MVNDLAISRTDDANVLISASDDGTIRLWDLDSRTALGPPLGGHESGAQAVAVNSSLIVTGDGLGVLHGWDLITRRPIDLGIPGQGESISCLRFMERGPR